MTATDQDNGGKVVYILGAGFSKPAGAPSQAGILEEILHLPDDGTRVAQAKEVLRSFLLNARSTKRGV